MKENTKFQIQTEDARVNDKATILQKPNNNGEYIEVDSWFNWLYIDFERGDFKGQITIRVEEDVVIIHNPNGTSKIAIPKEAFDGE